MLHVRTMMPADLPLGMALKDQAGWNQVNADWRRMLAMSPDGCFVAELDDRAAGTLATIVFGEVAWMAMLLVDTAARGRGVGTALMGHGLKHLDARGIRSIRLDATPQGRPIYEKLGFVPQYSLTRYEGRLRSLPAVSREAMGVISVKKCTDAVRPQLLALDRRVTSTDRSTLLNCLIDEYPADAQIALRDDEVIGYLLTRSGSRATHIGPCIAATADAGRLLLDHAAACHAGQRVYIDIPDDNTPAVAWAAARGLAPQRPFTRMCRGVQVNDDVQSLWCSSGPEKG